MGAALITGQVDGLIQAVLGKFIDDGTRADDPDLQLRRDMPRVIRKSMMLVGAILVILGCALGLTNFLVDAEVPMKIFAVAQQYFTSKWSFLLALNVFLLIVGGFLDIFSATFVVVPLITPVAREVGIDPIHLAIIDGYQGMEGYGPTRGTAVEHRVCVVGSDWLAADRVAIELMGIDFAKIGYLNYCADAGMGQAELKKIEIMGQPLARHVKTYRLAPNIEQQLIWMKPPT